jgi:hypothetical protein
MAVFLAMIFCAIVNREFFWNSFAQTQPQVQTQQAPTIAYS